MADLPTHPDTDDPSGQAPGAAASGRPRLGVIAAIIAVAALVVAIIVLHATGVIGPESH